MFTPRCGESNPVHEGCVGTTVVLVIFMEVKSCCDTEIPADSGVVRGEDLKHATEEKNAAKATPASTVSWCNDAIF